MVANEKLWKQSGNAFLEIFCTMSNSSRPIQCDGDTELRHLTPGYRNQLVHLLDCGDGWKELASVIPKPDKDDELLFSASDISTLEGYKFRPQGSPSNALFEHWSTFGRKRPTIRIFYNLLLKAKLHRAANVIAVDVLKEVPVENECDTSALNTLTETLALNGTVTDSVKEKCRNIAAASGRDSPESLEHYSYELLAASTRNFCDEPRGGCRLGEGAFGTVYKGTFGRGMHVAIKKLKEKISPQFITEMEILTACKHANLLPLLGYSVDGSFGCLVYEYMENGSLLDCLMQTAMHIPIPWTSRITIAIGVARGICHLHTFGKEPYVHRDIKSANILLDRNMAPKVGDFGLVRIGNNSLASTCIVTDTVIGTSVYMAPEAFRGDVSVKLDTFSFGVVLLELLTGLSPHDSNREETDILSYLEENCERIEDFLDQRANWSQSVALHFYNIATRCTEGRKKNRPTMIEVLPSFEELLQSSEKLTLSLSETLNGVTSV